MRCLPTPTLCSVARSIPDEDAGTEGAIFVFRRLVEEEEVEEEVRHAAVLLRRGQAEGWRHSMAEHERQCAWTRG